MRLWYTIGRCWCRFHIGVFHLGRVYNRHLVPTTGPLLIVSNHQSFLDPMLVGYALNREVDYMARDTLFKNPVFGRLIRSFNAFPVKRGEADLAAIKETMRRLKEDRAVLMFPEGTRTEDGRISEFKPGLALLAKKMKVPVVPAVIDGAFEAWPRKSPVPRPLVPIRVSYGEPFWPEEFSGYSPEEFVTIIHRRMIRMQDEIRTQAGKPPYNYEQERSAE